LVPRAGSLMQQEDGLAAPRLRVMQRPLRHRDEMTGDFGLGHHHGALIFYQPCLRDISGGDRVKRHERNMGFLRPPTADDLAGLAGREHLNLSLAECEELVPFAADFVRAFDDVEELPDLQVPVRYPRTAGSRPSPDDDPVNAFVRVLEIAGAPDGPLAGRR